MKLLTIALVIVLLTTASAKPMHRRWRQKADIGNKDQRQGWLNKYKWLSWLCSKNSSHEGSSSDESQESSESSEESSEEVQIPDHTTPFMPTTLSTPTTTPDRSTLSPTPGNITTNRPTAAPPTTTTAAVVITSPGGVTPNVTRAFPTAAPITDNRGDN